MSAARTVIGLQLQISPTRYVYVQPHEPESPKRTSHTLDGQSWLDVRKGDYIEVNGAPAKVLAVELHSGRPSLSTMPEIVSGRDWEEWGTILDLREPKPWRQIVEAAQQKQT